MTVEKAMAWLERQHRYDIQSHKYAAAKSRSVRITVYRNAEDVGAAFQGASLSEALESMEAKLCPTK